MGVEVRRMALRARLHCSLMPPGLLMNCQRLLRVTGRRARTLRFTERALFITLLDHCHACGIALPLADASVLPGDVDAVAPVTRLRLKEVAIVAKLRALSSVMVSWVVNFRTV